MTFAHVEFKIGQQIENFLPFLSSMHSFLVLTSVGVSHH